MANEHNNKRPTAASMLNIAAFCTALFAVGGLSIAMEKPTYSEQYSGGNAWAASG